MSEAISAATNARYKENCGRECPECLHEPIWRVIEDAKTYVYIGDDAYRIAEIPCYCPMCGEMWTEVYRLQKIKRTK